MALLSTYKREAYTHEEVKTGDVNSTRMKDVVGMYHPKALPIELMFETAGVNGQAGILLTRD